MITTLYLKVRLLLIGGLKADNKKNMAVKIKSIRVKYYG